MAAPFATAADLSSRLGVPAYTGDRLTQVELLLADASSELRSIIGWQVYPPATATVTARPGWTSHLDLPGFPITAVDAVTADGVALTAWQLIDGALYRAEGFGCGTLTVAYTVGYAAPPPELVTWTCVLASQALSALELLGSLGAGNTASVAIDDFRQAWTGDGAGGYDTPTRVADRLRATYGAGVYVTGSR